VMAGGQHEAPGALPATCSRRSRWLLSDATCRESIHMLLTYSTAAACCRCRTALLSLGQLCKQSR
jgi:hypothetical protein